VENGVDLTIGLPAGISSEPPAMNDIILIPPSRPAGDPEIQPPEDRRLPPPDGGADSRASRWKTLAAPASALFVVFGLGWASASVTRGSDHVVAEALKSAQGQRQDVAELRSHVDALTAKLEAQAQKTRGSEATIAALQKNLSEQKADAAVATSQMQAKLEKLQSLVAARSAENKSVDVRGADRTPVAAIPAAAAPQAAALPKPLPRAVPNPVAATLPPATIYRAYVLRDVAEGRAVVEGAQGLEEVGPGDMLPSGARVQRIERRGQGWVVLTDRGAINPDGRWDN
jgi:hypothetical protein